MFTAPPWPVGEGNRRHRWREEPSLGSGWTACGAASPGCTRLWRGEASHSTLKTALDLGWSAQSPLLVAAPGGTQVSGRLRDLKHSPHPERATAADRAAPQQLWGSGEGPAPARLGLGCRRAGGTKTLTASPPTLWSPVGSSCWLHPTCKGLLPKQAVDASLLGHKASWRGWRMGLGGKTDNTQPSSHLLISDMAVWDARNRCTHGYLKEKQVVVLGPQRWERRRIWGL